MHIGKGAREGLKISHNKDNENRIIETYKTRNEIERAIIEHNKEYYQQAHKIEVYNDKIYNQLKSHIMRDRILKRELIRHDCDNQSDYEFLQLLKQPESIQRKQYFQLINIEE